MRTVILAVVVGVGLVASGCRASVNANLRAGGKTKTQDDFAPSEVKGDSESEFDPASVALLGARHDLDLAKGAAPSCQCLAVVVGDASNAAFSWQGGPPTLDPSTQLVLGVSSEGLACPGAPADSLGASYWGYTLSGQDVIVIVEPARFGRPLTRGGIIPRPTGTGQVYVRPSAKGVPYGRSLDGRDPLCRVQGPSPHAASTP